MFIFLLRGFCPRQPVGLLLASMQCVQLGALGLRMNQGNKLSVSINVPLALHTL